MEYDRKVPCYECLCFPICKHKLIRYIMRCQYIKNYLSKGDATYRYELIIRYLRFGYI